MLSINDIVDKSAALKASDVHIGCGVPVRIRIDGKLQNLHEEKLTESDCRSLAEELLDEEISELEEVGEYDLGGTYGQDNLRCRVNLYKARGTYSCAIRILSDHIPEMEDLGLPKAVMNFPSVQKGLIIITGETGSGKSTTLASIVNRINHTRPDHIVTLEDPIEYMYEPALSQIDQREVGKDTQSYANGLRASLREDPDVILIGEMRDLQTIETALTAAETGHLVLATLHTNSAADSIDRIVDSFPGDRQHQIRVQLAQTLKAVVSQQLLPRVSGGRVLAAEVMIVNPAIKNLIREGKTAQIENSIASSADQGSVTMANYLKKLVDKHIISLNVAREASPDARIFEDTSNHADSVHNSFRRR